MTGLMRIDAAAIEGLLAASGRDGVFGATQVAGGVSSSVQETAASQMDCEGSGGGAADVFGQS